MTSHRGPLRVRNGYVLGFHADNIGSGQAQADYTIPAEEIIELNISAQANELKDSAKLAVRNRFGIHSGVVRHGDRIEFWVEDERVSTADHQYGQTQYGLTSYSSGPVLEWTGYVRNYSIDSLGGGNYTLNVDAEDFVYAILGSRRFYGTFSDKPLAGSSDSILNEALQTAAPELDRSRLDDVGITASYVSNGKYLLDILRDCLALGDAVSASENTSLVFTDPEALGEEFTMTPASEDYSRESYKSNDDNLVNSIRVRGGASPKLDVEDATVSSTNVVTEDQYVSAQVSTRKSSIAEVEVYTLPSGAEEDVTVAIQDDDGGSPIAPLDSKSDIVRKTLSHEFLASSDWTTFIMPGHTLPSENVHIVVRGGGSTGQNIGVTGTGSASYRVYFPYTTTVSVDDYDSQDLYRRRDGKHIDETIRSTKSAEQVGKATLRHDAWPKESFSFDAYSGRSYTLNCSDIVRIEDNNLAVDGLFVIMSAETTYTEDRLYRSVTAVALDSL